MLGVGTNLAQPQQDSTACSLVAFSFTLHSFLLFVKDPIAWMQPE